MHATSDTIPLKFMEALEKALGFSLTFPPGEVWIELNLQRDLYIKRWLGNGYFA